MRVFTRIRKGLTDHTKLSIEIAEIKKQLNNHSQNIDEVFKYLDELTSKKEVDNSRRRIGFKSDDL